ncbi:MAG: restriction endonuclease subunit S, partial [Fibrobacteria bacterium]|nr:restriction endonuclease subunit S [Fibrobacteria bacterium]
MPEGWQSGKVGSLCHFTNGNGFRPEDWKESGLPIIRIQNLNGSKDFNYYQGDVKPSWIVNPGDLLFAWAGVKGVSFGPAIWRGERGVLNQHIFSISSSSCDKKWLYYALVSVTSSIESNAHGFKSSLLHVHKSDITDSELAIPPLPEQKAIADTLSTWDTAIETMERLIAAKERRLTSLVHLLITPSSASNDTRKVKVGSILSESRIVGSPGDQAQKLTVKLYGKGVVPKSDARHGSASTQYYVRRAGQFIYSKLDFLNGAFGIIPDELDGYESTLDLPAFDVSPDASPDWLLYFFTRPEFYENQLELARGQRIARRVNPPDFLASTIDLPPVSAQLEAVSILNQARTELTLLRKQFELLQRQKRGLMQKLL